MRRMTNPNPKGEKVLGSLCCKGQLATTVTLLSRPGCQRGRGSAHHRATRLEGPALKARAMPSRQGQRWLSPSRVKGDQVTIRNVKGVFPPTRLKFRGWP